MSVGQRRRKTDSSHCVCLCLFVQLSLQASASFIQQECSCTSVSVSLRRLPQCPQRESSVLSEQRRLQIQQPSKEPPGLFGSEGLIIVRIG